MHRLLFTFGLSVAFGLVSTKAELPKIGLKPVWKGLELNRPLWMEPAPDGSGRLFCIEQGGGIVILPKEKSSSKRQEFFNINDRKPWVENEEGLLGLAFHPDWGSGFSLPR